jgi:hypothetical protein
MTINPEVSIDFSNTKSFDFYERMTSSQIEKQLEDHCLKACAVQALTLPLRA